MGAHKIPSKCKRCVSKYFSKELDVMVCRKHIEFKKDCSKEDFKLDKRRENFQKMCSRVMKRRTKNNGWSQWERKVEKNVLLPEGLVLDVDFKHNYRAQNEEQTGYFELDFFLFRLGGVLEADGEAWHGEMGHGDEKDIRRDLWFMKWDCPTFRVKSEKDFEKARQFIQELKIRNQNVSKQIGQLLKELPPIPK